MMNFDERAVPGITSNYLMCEAQSRYRFALNQIKADGIVLDLACGTGYGASILATKSSAVYGIDISDEALTFARDNYSDNKVTFIKNSVYETIFRDRSADLVVAFEMIEHLNSVKKFLDEVSRVIKPRGTFILSTPNADYSSPDGNLMSPFHTKEYTFEELEKILKKSFHEVTLYSQTVSHKAAHAHDRFMDSQLARSSVVSADIFSIRKFIPKSMREKLWKTLGALFGRGEQESLKVSDFPIKKGKLQNAHYIVAVCKRPR